MQSLNDIVVTKLLSAQTIYSPQYQKCHITDRFAYGLSFCQSGRITYHLNNKKYISDPEHAILLPMGQSYTLHRHETGNFPLINFHCTDTFSATEFMVFPLKNPQIYLKAYEHLHHSMMLPHNHHQSMSIFYDILSHLASETKKERGILTPVLTYLENNYMNPNITNADLAEKAHISEVYFRKLFKEQFHLTPGRYLTDIRMYHAKQLLSESRLSVTQIAEKSGYSSVYLFCRAFKRHTGQTPLEYRASQLNQGI